MRILVACRLDPLALERLARDHDVECCAEPCAGELARRIRGRDVLVVRGEVSVTREILEAADELRLIVRAGSGVDHIDTAEVARRGIELVRIPAPGARAAAELTVSLMLALARQVVRADTLLRGGRWAKHDLPGVQLAGSTLGLVGVGNVGSRVGPLGAAFGMRVLGCVGRARAGTAARLRRLGIEHASFDEVVARSDFLSLHVPLEEATRGLVGEEVLAKVKPGAFLVNTARAGVVDADALYRSLRYGGRLRGAALDVHEHEGTSCLSPLRHLPNVILTPRLGAMTAAAQRAIGQELLDIVEDFAADPREPALAALGG